MKFIKLVLCALVFVLLSACGNKEYPPIQVLGTTFIIQSADKDGKPNFVESTKVPLIPGQRYGWKIFFRSNREEIKYLEALVLADKAKFVVGKDKQSNETKHIEIMDGRGVLISRSVPNNGTLYGGWVVAKGDPPGNAEITVYMNKKAIKVFKFELVAQDSLTKEK